MTMTNNDVATFQGTNQDLCEGLGKFASPDSPPHFYNFTAKSMKDRAKIAVAEGKGGEVFELKSRQRKSTAPANPAATAIVQLPQNLMALLPALHLMLQTKGHDLDCGLKQWVLNESTPASIWDGCEAVLPDEVTEFLGMFGMDTSENESMLLAYAGVKTLRAVKVDRISGAIKELAAINIQSLSDDRLDDLERVLLDFALTGDKDEHGRLR